MDRPPGPHWVGRARDEPYGAEQHPVGLLPTVRCCPPSGWRCRRCRSHCCRRYMSHRHRTPCCRSHRCLRYRRGRGRRPSRRSCCAARRCLWSRPRGCHSWCSRLGCGVSTAWSCPIDEDAVAHPSHDVVVDIDRAVAGRRRGERVPDDDPDTGSRVHQGAPTRALDDVVADLATDTDPEGRHRTPAPETPVTDELAVAWAKYARTELWTTLVVDHTREALGDDTANDRIADLVVRDQRTCTPGRGVTEQRVDHDDASIHHTRGARTAGARRHDPVAPDLRVP